MYNLNPQDEFKEIQKSAIFRGLVKEWRERGFNRHMSKTVVKAMMDKPKEKGAKPTFANDAIPAKA